MQPARVEKRKAVRASSISERIMIILLLLVLSSLMVKFDFERMDFQNRDRLNLNNAAGCE
jgi:hypothetical protein